MMITLFFHLRKIAKNQEERAHLSSFCGSALASVHCDHLLLVYWRFSATARRISGTPCFFVYVLCLILCEDLGKGGSAVSPAGFSVKGTSPTTVHVTAPFSPWSRSDTCTRATGVSTRTFSGTMAAPSRTGMRPIFRISTTGTLSFSSRTARTTVVRSVRGGWPRSLAVTVNLSWETSSLSILWRTLSHPDASSNRSRRRTDSVAAPKTYSTWPLTPTSRSDALTWRTGVPGGAFSAISASYTARSKRGLLSLTSVMATRRSACEERGGLPPSRTRRISSGRVRSGHRVAPCCASRRTQPCTAILDELIAINSVPAKIAVRCRGEQVHPALKRANHRDLKVQETLVLIKYHLTLRKLLPVDPPRACGELTCHIVNFKILRATLQGKGHVAVARARREAQVGGHVADLDVRGALLRHPRDALAEHVLTCPGAAEPLSSNATFTTQLHFRMKQRAKPSDSLHASYKTRVLFTKTFTARLQIQHTDLKWTVHRKKMNQRFPHQHNRPGRALLRERNAASLAAREERERRHGVQGNPAPNAPTPLWQRPASMPSSPSVWITATKPRTGSSICRTASVLTRIKPWQHITPTLIHLHWLPVKSHISYSSPTNPSMPLSPSTYPISFTPIPHPRICCPQTRVCSPAPGSTHSNLLTFRDRAFSVAAPALWNCLLATTHNAASLDTCKKRVKTYLFPKAYHLDGSSSVHRVLNWEPEGRRFKTSTDHRTECGQVAGEVPVHLLGAAELPLSKAPNP
ncbi:hypothetical protein N1851_007690 [Merluccius polli]|uniref:Uncharacterized protein n=1 Tax=Merluccius polli TaxID=89951 RepID=A0AA47N3I5_MERPO|nr:hypothetical protein N1851_007690 [Merluccius polli]